MMLTRYTAGKSRWRSLASDSGPKYLLLSLLLPLLPGIAGADVHEVDVEADFNGDQISDLAIGIPNTRVGGRFEAGSVLILYGAYPGGLTASGSQQWDQNQAGVPGDAEQDDHFGRSLAVGDFDDDGFDDLVIGIPDDDVVANDDGAILVLYGSSEGLSDSRSERFWEDKINRLSEANDHFGFSLATSDFNGDGYDDVAVGVPYENIGGVSDAGSVVILFGSRSGLSESGTVRIHQDGTSVRNEAEANDNFGFSVAAGNLDDDAFDDLIVGIPHESIHGISGCGAFAAFYGSASGPNGDRDQIWDRDNLSVAGSAGAGDRLGYSVAVGDFNRDGFDDAAAGAPNDDQGGAINAGSVSVLYGSRSGLQARNDEIWHQNSTGILGSCQDYDEFGLALVAADFDGDRRCDLAISAPFEDRGSDTDAGVVHVLYGTSGGLSYFGNQRWDQAEPGICGRRESYDRFGMALTTGDFDGNGIADLVVGTPEESVSDTSGDHMNAGAVNVIYGTADRLDAAGDQIWSRNSAGVIGDPVYEERLGDAVASSAGR